MRKESTLWVTLFLLLIALWALAASFVWGASCGDTP